MSQRRHTTLVAAGATILASMPLSTVFATWSWLVHVVFVIAAMTIVALGIRSLRAPALAATAGMAVTFLFILTWMFRSGHEIAGLLPSGRTFAHFQTLILSAGQDMRDLGIPVDDRDSLLFLSTLGVGAVAIVIDLLAVVARRPALTGLPMLAVYSVPVAVHQDSVNFLSFAAGAAGYLWLLVSDNVDRIRRFGRRFTGDGRDVDLWEPSPLAAAGRRLAVVGVLAAVAIPPVLPGGSTGLLDRFGTAGGDGNGSGPGSGSSVDMYAMLSGQLNTDRTFDMVKVQTNDPSPYYLRFGVADEVTPGGFRNQSPSGGTSASAALPAPAAGPGTGISTHAYRASVQIMSLNMRTLPVYLQPTRTSKLDSSWLYDREDQVLYSRRSDSRGRKYSFEYARLGYDPDALAAARPLGADDDVQRRYTVVPKLAEVDEILAPVLAGRITPYDKVRAILGYFSTANGFRYSLQTKSGTSGSAIVDFLDNKQGFCEQYSAAMAWLVRAAGIPARVAFGFSRGSDRSGDTWTLTNRNLHAWTEVYFDRFGWVPFDPTPSAYVNGVESSWAPDPSKPQPAPGAGTGSEDLPRPGSAGAGASSSAAPGTRPDQINPNGPAGIPTAPVSPAPWLTLAGVLVVLAVLLSPGVWRQMVRRRRWPDRGPPPPVAVSLAAGSRDVTVVDDGTADRGRAHAAWDELIDTMIDFRLTVDPAATPRVTAEHLITEVELAERALTGARLLARAEERARYARQPLVTGELADSLGSIRDAIIHRVSWRTRIQALLFPASVLQQWRGGATQRWARLADAAVRRRAALAHAVDVRRLLPHRS